MKSLIMHIDGAWLITLSFSNSLIKINSHMFYSKWYNQKLLSSLELKTNFECDGVKVIEINTNEVILYRLQKDTIIKLFTIN